MLPVEFTKYDNNKKLYCTTGKLRGYTNLDFIGDLLLADDPFIIRNTSGEDVTRLSLASLSDRIIRQCKDSSKVRKAVRTLIKELRDGEE